jgi:sigma-B regulation protein RsbQ
MNQNILRRNNVKIFGNGTQTMIFAHGFGCDQNMWRFVTPAFEKDYKIILFDYVGCGNSDLTAYSENKYNSLESYAQDLIDICDTLELKDIIFVGHSVSSIIGILAHIKAPQLFKTLILVCPSPRYINDLPEYIGGFAQKDIEDLLDLMDKNYLGWASFLAPVIMQNEDKPELTQELQESFCSTDPVIANRFARITFFGDNREDLPKITIPSLILQCSDDAIAPVEVGYYLAKNLPQSTLKIMKATGHCPHLSNPEETIKLIKEYKL